MPVFDYFTKITECPCKKATSPDENGLCPPCSTPTVLSHMTRIVKEKEQQTGNPIPEKPISDNTSLNKMAALTKCNSERCVLESNYILRYVTPNEVKQCLNNMKPEGPRVTRDWLSNFNIDNVLTDFAEQYPELYVFPTTMSDFKEHGDELGLAAQKIPQLLDNNKKYFASVVNTDKYTSCTNGGNCGKHWVAVFIDTNKLPDAPWTVEYFDSVGHPPNDYIMAWQVEMQAVLKLYRNNKGHTGDVLILTNTTQHQKENNECGVYSLYYVMSRAEGISQSRFNSQPISDAAMINFRKYLFS